MAIQAICTLQEMNGGGQTRLRYRIVGQLGGVAAWLGAKGLRRHVGQFIAALSTFLQAPDFR